MEGIDIEVMARKTVGEFVREFPDESQRQFIEKGIQDWQHRSPDTQALWVAVRELRAEIRALTERMVRTCTG
jgi:hypothetical protein